MSRTCPSPGNCQGDKTKKIEECHLEKCESGQSKRTACLASLNHFLAILSYNDLLSFPDNDGPNSIVTPTIFANTSGKYIELYIVVNIFIKIKVQL